MAAQGAIVALADINIDGALAVTQEIRDSGASASAVAVDVADVDQIERAVTEAASALGGTGYFYAITPPTCHF